MVPYKNLSGDSGVVAYAIGKGWIDVRFVEGGTYRYTLGSVGAADLATMQALAVQGRGLSSFISRQVRERYAFRRD